MPHAHDGGQKHRSELLKQSDQKRYTTERERESDVRTADREGGTDMRSKSAAGLAKKG